MEINILNALSIKIDLAVEDIYPSPAPLSSAIKSAPVRIPRQILHTYGAGGVELCLRWNSSATEG
jgi:hypothetical protein